MSSTENPPAAAGTALVADAEPAVSAFQPAQVVAASSSSTENPPAGHGSVVVGQTEQDGTGDHAAPDEEAPAQSEQQKAGLHAADAAPLVEPEVG